MHNHDASRLSVDRAEYDALLQEMQHQEEVLQRLADPASAEGRVAHKAYQRMTELVDTLNLDDAHIELAQEVRACSGTVRTLNPKRRSLYLVFV